MFIFSFGNLLIYFFKLNNEFSEDMSHVTETPLKFVFEMHDKAMCHEKVEKLFQNLSILRKNRL